VARLGANAVPTCLLLLVAAAIGVDASRIGFFADDFHFLDVARRFPLTETLLGQRGIWPWFRPLSRELYFKLVVAAGPLSLVLAHALSLACVFGCAWALWRVARRLIGRDGAAVAAILFVTYDLTKFLTAWPSGFQDLLGMLLTLLAIDAYQLGRPSLALAWAFLAPFAKESAFIVFPLLVACAYLGSDRRPTAAWLRSLAGAAGVAVFVHLVVRLAWRSGGTTPRAELAPEQLPSVVGHMVMSFIGSTPVWTDWTPWLAVTAGVAALLLILASARNGLATSAWTPTRAMAFASIGFASAVAPVVVAHLMNVTTAQSYQLFPASPWLAVLFARLVTAFPVRVWRVGVPLLAVWNVGTTGLGRPNLEDSATWNFHEWSWRGAVRFSAVTERLRADVREQLSARPESLVVLYEGMPPTTFFQTEDGPATREALRDLSVRAHWVNEPPPDVSASRLSILSFDLRRFRLETAHWSNTTAVRRAIDAMLARRGNAANAFALYESSPDSAIFDRGYVRAAAALLNDGPRAFVAGLANAGLNDTLGTQADVLAEPIAAVDPLLGRALATVLHHPLDASTHVALADSLLRRGVAARAGLELRIAVTLDPTRLEDRYRLAMLLVSVGGTVEALAELRELRKAPSLGALESDVDAAIQRLEPLGPPATVPE
jgi:hypothetical protein